MTISLESAVVYDIETTISAFTMYVCPLYGDDGMVFEISSYRDDRRALLAWFEHWRNNEILMIGYNNVFFDYPVLHFIFGTPDCTVAEIYECAQERIKDHTNFGIIWQSDRFAPQLDLLKMMHFDNQAKRTSLKALEFAMRSESVLEMPLPFDRPMTSDQILDVLIPYNRYDVEQTKKFAIFNIDAIKFRIDLSETLKGDVLNFSDSKIGSKIMEQRLGDKLCYTWESGRKEPRQSPRATIPLGEIIFPYIEFQNAEFNRVLSWMRLQTLSEDEVTGRLKTKGVFTNIKANVGGIDFHFGTGGIHGSISAQCVVEDAEWAIVDVDVAQLYPQIAIQNNLAPEHLGERFTEEYAQLPIERKAWQVKKGKKCPEANSMKLASNGTYGNSNNEHSFLRDPRFTMQITINGQLMLCMLAEWLLTVEGLQILQINTDGITYRCRRDRLEHAEIIRNIWMRRTRMVLEEVRYSKVWLRDVNSYIAQPVKGDLKQKGAFWYPAKFPDDISNAQPPAWHKDLGGQIIIMAAVAHMVEGVDIESYIDAHRDPFDFMLRAKCDRSSELWIGDQKQQRILRYFIAHNGGPLRKVSPPTGEPGTFKRRSGITDLEWSRRPSGGEWSEAHHTKNKSKYETREMAIEAGHLVAQCNLASDFDFSRLNYQFYVDAAKKLVIA